MTASLADRFGAAMAACGPYGSSPRLAAGVSGGADSMALALLARDWAATRGGSIIALIADHGLRAESGGEAERAASLLAARGIEARTIRLGLERGPALQNRARTARHEALARAAREAGAVHLLLGHHLADQAETALMRAARGRRGLAAMAMAAARHDVVLLRPLLGIAPEALRVFLRERNCGWIEDPSNADRRFERVALRDSLAGGAMMADLELVRQAGEARQSEMRAISWFLARRAEIRPEGHALLRGDEMPPDALAALLRVIGGAVYPPRREAVERLAASMRPATLGGVRIVPAGRLLRGGKGWLLAREPAACAPARPLAEGVVWDGRFRVLAAPAGADRIGCLGASAANFRRRTDLPALILETLPVLYDREHIVAIPHLGYGPCARLSFTPPEPVSPHPFVPHLFV